MKEHTWAELQARFEGRIKPKELLSKHTSLRIGGPVRYWAEVQSQDELLMLLQRAATDNLPVFPVGLGSNVLFPDHPIDAVAVRLGGELARWRVLEANESQATVEVGGGAVNAHLVRGLLKEGFVGMEFLVLIPGTFGGAVAMNAGTKEKELSAILHDVDLVSTVKTRKVMTVAANTLNMTYRHAELHDQLVVAGRIAVSKGDVDAAAERVRLDKERRNETQPYRLASVGSTFANPEGDYAGRLIEEVGLKGMACGGARISAKHANFFINEGDATADDFIRLMATARVKVRQRFGVELRPEVRFQMFDGWSRMLDMESELEKH